MKRLYTLVGLLWGLVLGIMVGFWVAAIASGISWLFLFGDDPWPEAVGWVIPLIALLVGLATTLGCTVGGYVVGTRLERSAYTDASGARKRGYLLGGIALLVAIGMAISMLTSARDDDRQRQDLTRQEAGMSALVQSRHQVSTIVVSGPDADETFRVTIHMNGSRQGPYTLYLAIRDQGRRKTLLENTQVINLTGGEQTAVFQVLLKKLKNNYKKLVLNHRGGALVEEDFMVQVTLQPLLSEKEKQALPRNELQNLGLGESRLIQTGSTHFPVRFIVR